MSVTAPAVTAPAPPAIPPVPPVDALTTRLIAQHGTVENALRYLVTASIQTDADIASVTRERDQLRAKLPDGAIVLTKEAAASWTKLQALKLTPEEIEAAVKKLPEVEGRLTRHDREKEYRVAGAAGAVDSDAFVDLAFRHNLVTEIKDVTVRENGKDVIKKVPFVKVATDDKAQPIPFTEFMAKLQPHEQRALQAAPPKPTGVPAHEQQRTPTTNAPTDLVAAEIEKQHTRAASRPNPLFPARKPAGVAQ